mmetsp:Transcript_3305/g.13605  ORF Transcript_3305/g.13605 Transcript_3305/m.13605 type:complete len:249 (+) Transcript_3305:773-1519(+)
MIRVVSRRRGRFVEPGPTATATAPAPTPAPAPSASAPAPAPSALPGVPCPNGVCDHHGVPVLSQKQAKQRVRLVDACRGRVGACVRLAERLAGCNVQAGREAAVETSRALSEGSERRAFLSDRVRPASEELVQVVDAVAARGVPTGGAAPASKQGSAEHQLACLGPHADVSVLVPGALLLASRAPPSPPASASRGAPAAGRSGSYACRIATFRVRGSCIDCSRCGGCVLALGRLDRLLDNAPVEHELG